MRLAVLLAEDTPNLNKLPAQWPVSADPVTDDAVIIQYPRIEMTPLQYTQHRNAYQGAYDAWEANQELEAYRPIYVEKLWQSAYDYNFQYFSGGAYSQILKLEMAGVSRAQDNDNWILALWGDYYMRKAIVESAASIDSINAVSLDFSGHGAPPWSVLDMLAQAQGG